MQVRITDTGKIDLETIKDLASLTNMPMCPGGAYTGKTIIPMAAERH